MVTPEEIGRFCAGDSDAMRSVYRAYGRLVFAITHDALGSRELAEEATQETFVKAWRAAKSFDPGRDLGPWLATIARRTAIDLHRREARRATTALEHEADRPAAVDVATVVGRSFEVWEVRRAVDELPDDERAVVRLQHLEGLTHAEVAERLNVPLGTVKSRSHRAHQRLAAGLGHLRGSER